MGVLKKLTKIGNSYGIILPKEILDQLGIDEKTEVEIELRENELALKPIRMKDFRVMKAFLSVVRDYDRTLKKLAEETGNQSFLDGNKRTAVTSAVTFLRLNGYDLKFSAKNREKAVYDMVMNVATKKMSREELAAWFQKNSRRKRRK